MTGEPRPGAGDLVGRLRGGDRRSIGNANAVVRVVLGDRARLGEIIAGLGNGDRIVRMRCADVAEKVSARQPTWLAPYKSVLLDLAGGAQEPEVRWHLAQMLPRLALDTRERAFALRLLAGYLKTESRIVQTCALQALVAFAREDPALARRVRPLVRRLARTGEGALRARAGRLQRLFD